MKLKYLGYSHMPVYRSSACSNWAVGETREVSTELGNQLLSDHPAAFEVTVKKVKKAEVKTEEVKTATVDRSIKRKAKKT